MSKQKIITGIKLIEGALKSAGAKGDELSSMMNNVANHFSSDFKERIQLLITLRDNARKETFTISKKRLNKYQDLCFELYAEISQVGRVHTNKKEEHFDSLKVLDMSKEDTPTKDLSNSLSQIMSLIKDLNKAVDYENKPYYAIEFKWFLKGLFDTSADHFVNAFDELEEEGLRRRKFVDEINLKLNA